ncbi:hypothetical protein ABH931_004157 [Streptacidiphilus sp. MAP12-33]|uniref:hypothetical protein n=1 Tax=Streptacidiphilus sp. MAP12-33 TaxID=3156266 RepID=UPI003512EBAB
MTSITRRVAGLITGAAALVATAAVPASAVHGGTDVSAGNKYCDAQNPDSVFTRVSTVAPELGLG